MISEGLFTLFAFSYVLTFLIGGIIGGATVLWFHHIEE